MPWYGSICSSSQTDLIYSLVFYCFETQRGTLIFLYIHRLGPFFLVQNFEFHYIYIFIFFFFQKNEYFLGYEVFVDIFWGHHKIGLYLGVISMHFMVFS